MTDSGKEFENKEDNLLEEDKSKINTKCIIISAICILLIIAIVLILVFTVFSKKEENDKPDRGSEEDKTQIDTIPPEEMNKARQSFKQYNFTEDSKVLSYNLFVPENYTKDEKYPLVMFISDKSLVGKEVTAPITETVGGPIWATDTVQKKHPCFVLVPQYNEGVVDGTWKKSEYLNITLNLISKLEKDYSIDKNRIYGTGQSMGAMTTLYLLANHQDLFAAGLIADGHWLLEQLYGLVNATFTFFAAEGDPNPFNTQNEVKEYFNNISYPYGSLELINARENAEVLNKETDAMYQKGNKQNFISFAKGTVVNPGSEGKGEHMASFKYAYRLERVREWIFEQEKKE
jgi:predicted peptidase